MGGRGGRVRSAAQTPMGISNEYHRSATVDDNDQSWRPLPLQIPASQCKVVGMSKWIRSFVASLLFDASSFVRPCPPSHPPALPSHTSHYRWRP